MTADPADLSLVIERIVVAFRTVGVPYFITGSFASSMHGEFRATNDVDFVADFRRGDLPGLLRELSSEFIGDPAVASIAISRGESFNLIHATTYLKVDVFPATGEFERQALRRAISVTLPGAGASIAVAAVEDILRAKLRRFRAGGEVSAVQQRDIERLVTLNREQLDLTHLTQWAAVLGVSDLLERAIVR
ncbi:hypothetical protein [Gemmatimonas sp.]|uniref:hypothetical protein n=1 Tax=Gemmatimonas sp. TaxID=1962908 RepID=UPI00286A0033|nr:hypothetical protein [Gemmatimonas sp.]